MNMAALFRSQPGAIPCSENSQYVRSVLATHVLFFSLRSSRALVLLLSAVSLTATLLYAQQTTVPPKRSFKLESKASNFSVWNEFPRWSGGHLVGFDNNSTSAPILYTTDSSGRRTEVLFTMADAARITVQQAAGAPDRSIAIVGGAYTNDTRGTTFLALVSADRQNQTITRTWPYCPMLVTVAADGIAWTIGRLKNDEGTKDLAEPILRRYNSSGEMISSSKVAVSKHPSLETAFLSASNDRVGWLTTGGEYIEFSLSGNEITRYEGFPDIGKDREISGMALSAENDVVVGLFGAGKGEFVALDRSSRTWTPVSLPREHAPIWARVLGFDGTKLVTTTGNGVISRFETK